MLAKSCKLGGAGLALVMVLALAPGASAVVVHSHGQFLGVAPRPGVAPAAIPGSVTAAGAAATPLVSSQGSWWDNLDYQGGPVLHSSSPYLIYWDPTQSIPSSWQSLIQRYFTDVAGDSGKATNVYAVGRQFTDSTGFADYQQTFNPSSQVIQDSNSYPTRDATNCASSPYANCVTDSQLQSEISSVIAANGLPSDGSTGASELPSGAPIYFVVLPSDVDVCFDDGSGTCASNYFCAYHSDYADGTNNVLYSAIPTVALNSAQDAKGCQWDGNSLVQQPNGSVADVALKYISHEDNETITDPLGTGWWNDWSGYENGDNCNDYETNADAFTPTLGGDASAGTLYNQLIGGDQYYLQSEWSNGGAQCLMEPSGGTITPRFSVPAGPRTVGSALSFDPTTSTSTYGFTSETWDFGDGTATSFSAGHTLTAATHTYAAAGDYTITLTLVDRRGDLSSASEKIAVGADPTASFAASPTQLLEGSGPVSFDATASTTGAGATIVSYAWDFGDGATAQGATASHTYATAGTYLASLTITDSAGLIDTATSTITVTDEPPVAAFTIGASTAEAGQSVGFDGSSSSDSDGSITWYHWDFGDGHTATGATPSHTYSTPGTYTVTLTVTDSSWQRSTVTQQLTVLAGPTASFTPSTGQTLEGTQIAFNGTASAGGALDATIGTYTWSFGDGSTGAGATASHAYAAPGVYTVNLTVTDGAGASSSTTQQVSILDESPTALFGATPVVPMPGAPVAFDGRASYDPDGYIVSYAWNFGDGAYGAGPTPSHSYAAAGTYLVRLTIVDRDGQQASVVKPVTVYAQPQAIFSYAPALPVERVAAAFAATALGTGPGSMISSYAWNFGDGTTATGPTAAHAYAREGSYRVTLAVTNGFGITTTITEVVTVTDAPPVAVIALLSKRPAAGHRVTFGGGRSHDSDDPVVSYLWHFGDRRAAVGRKVTHTYARPGFYRVSLTVRDSFGQAATTTVTVRVFRPGARRDARHPRRRPRRR